jgi:hypothetical protein
MAKFGLKEGRNIVEVFEADTVVVYPPHKTAVFYSGLDEWRETARIDLKPGQTIETDQSRLPSAPSYEGTAPKRQTDTDANQGPAFIMR